VSRSNVTPRPLNNQSRPVGYRDQRPKASGRFEKHSHIPQVEIR